jgi:short-subunit dehydrogenase
MKPVCLVTGAASGLGRELLAALSADYQLVAIDVDSQILPIVAAKFSCDFRICDVADYQSVQMTVNYLIDKYHRLDCLINCAGLYLDGELTANDPAKIKQTVLVNSLGPINLSKAVIPELKRQKSGIIVNIVSTAGLHPRARCSVYHASKYALTGFGQSLALELEPHGIKVVNIYPDLMNTNFSRQGSIKRDFSRALNPDGVVNLINYILSLDPHTTLPDITLRYL